MALPIVDVAAEGRPPYGAGVASAFLRILTLLALMLAPLGMPAMAEAVPPSSHHAAMKSGGDCEQQQPNQHHKAADKDCCVAMCIAVVVPSSIADLPYYQASRKRPASDVQRRGFLGEIATPPPRFV